MPAEDFTLEFYAGLLDTAIRSGYRFASYDELGNGAIPKPPAILLRHDIDYSPALIAPLARLEAERGVKATYFFQLDSHFYDGEGEAASSAIELLLAGGHELGLHFDATSIAEDREVVSEVERAASLLELRWDVPVRAVSFHMPGLRPVGHIELGARVNTYAPVFFEQLAYASDSNQDWRGFDIVPALAEVTHPRLQLLIHPFWWRREPSRMFHKLEGLAREHGLAVREVLTGAQVSLMSERERELAGVEAGDDPGPLSPRLRVARRAR